MGEFTQRGIDAFKSGQKKEARQFLSQAVLKDPNDLQAWLYLAAVVDSDRERSHCLTQALRIDPAHAGARQGLEKIRAQQGGPKPASPFFTSDATDVQAVGQPGAVQPQPPALGTVRADSRPEVWSPADLRQKKAGAADPTADKKSKAKAVQPRPNSKRTLWLTAVFLIMLIVAAGTALMMLLPGLATTQAAAPPPASPLPAIVNTPTLAQTSTPWPTATQTPTITPKPTRTVTPTQTLMPLGPTVELQMQTIARQVSDLRGLPIKADVPAYLVSKQQAKEFLLNSYITQDLRAELEHQKRTLVALGLVKDTYDMVEISMNHMVDNIGGFYTPWEPQIFMLAVRFGGIEHYVYSHEFTHAITDQNFDFAAMGHSPCNQDAQRCAAVDALIEGDASLLMEQWWQQYAGPQDYRDIQMYIPPLFMFNQPNQFPPPFAGLDASFPYQQGKAFVKVLYDRGNWAEVDQAYQNPPSSTEQILHPEKYFAGEEPINVDLPEVTSALGEGWQLADEDSLGEWKTYLLLGYPADVKSSVPEETALLASQGWGGDQYQLYYHAENKQSVLAAQWVWDSAAEQSEFSAAFRTQLNERFRGGALDRGRGECWSANQQVTCLYSSGSRTLWLLAPAEKELDAVLASFADF